MTIKQIEAVDVLLNIINGEDVFMCRRYQNGNVGFTRLRDATIGKINEFLKNDSAAFIIVERSVEIDKS